MSWVLMNKIIKIGFFQQLIYLIPFLALTGCSTLQPVTTKELMNEENLYETTKINLSISEIKEKYRQYLQSMMCSWKTQLYDNEPGLKISWYTEGLVEGHDNRAIIDFQQINSEHPYVIAKIYICNIHWRKTPMEFIKILRYDFID